MRFCCLHVDRRALRQEARLARAGRSGPGAWISRPLPLSFPPLSVCQVVLGSLGSAPLRTLGLVLQLAAVGRLVGSLVALRASGRWDCIDRWGLATAWTGVGAVVGVIVVLVALVL